MSNNPNNCKGCYSVIGEKEDCYYKEFSESCPCITCLLKMVCVDICDDHKNFQIESNNREDHCEIKRYKYD